MKRLVNISLFCFVFFGNLISQEIYTITEEMPEFPGGSKEMMLFIQKNILYPAPAREQSVGGKVYIKFVVDSSGSITNAVVIKSAGFDYLDKEALRVVSLMPKWKPGKQNNRTVSVYFNLPIVFSMDQPYFVCNVSNKDEDYIASMEKIKIQDRKGALELLNKTIEKNPNDGDALYNKSMVYFYYKDGQKGCEYLNLALVQKHQIAEKVINKYCNK